MEEHEHEFVEHVGVPIASGRATAWVRVEPLNTGVIGPKMLRCKDCLEQGYKIPVSA